MGEEKDDKEPEKVERIPPERDADKDPGPIPKTRPGASPGY